MTKEQEEGLEACVKVRDELLRNLSKIQDGDPVCQLERGAGGKTLADHARELESELGTTKDIMQ